MQADLVSHVIQLAVAPVFLLTGIAGILGVLANRVGRIIDRARLLESQLEAADDRDKPRLHQGLQRLSKRARLASHAITACVIAALLVTATIVVLFLAAFGSPLPTLAAVGLFVMSMLALLVGLLLFLREVLIATATLRIGPHPD